MLNNTKILIGVKIKEWNRFMKSIKIVWWVLLFSNFFVAVTVGASPELSIGQLETTIKEVNFKNITDEHEDFSEPYADAFKLIEVWLEAQKDFENIPSITAMAVKNQKLIWSGAFGQSNIEQKVDADTSTISSICSMTKTFTAVATMRLVDEGKLSLDDTVDKLLPHFNIIQKYPQGGAITVRSLLSHSSGLPGNTGHSYFSPPHFLFPTKAEFHSALKELETKSPVGAESRYSNIGISLLGEIIENVSGMTYENYLQKYVFDPLAMSDTFIELQRSNYDKKQARGYTALNRNGTRKAVNMYQTRAMKPAMGISTTIIDLAKYASWQFRLREGNATEILMPDTLKNMHSVHPTTDNGGGNWGLGFRLFTDQDGDKWAMHGGTCPGYVSMLQLNLTDKMAYAVIINANRTNAWKYINGVKQILSKVEPSTVEAKKNNLIIKDYVGYYDMNPWNSEVYVAAWGKDLVVLQLPEDNPGNAMRFYKHVKDDTFRLVKENGELGNAFIFERDKQGKVVRYNDEGNFKNKISKSPL